MSGSPLILTPQTNERSFVKWWLIFFIFAVLVVLGMIAALSNTQAASYRAFVIPSSAMEPTVLQDDHIIADMNYYRPRKPRDGDIVLYKRVDTIFIKRIIASPGETVKGSGG
jgi:signal peptidase I